MHEAAAAPPRAVLRGAEEGGPLAAVGKKEVAALRAAQQAAWQPMAVAVGAQLAAAAVAARKAPCYRPSRSPLDVAVAVAVAAPRSPCSVPKWPPLQVAVAALLMAVAAGARPKALNAQGCHCRWLLGAKAADEAGRAGWRQPAQTFLDWWLAGLQKGSGWLLPPPVLLRLAVAAAQPTGQAACTAAPLRQPPAA